MTIDLKPEQEQVVGQAIRAGLIQDAGDVIALGVEMIRERLEARRSSSNPVAKNLVELFADSPFAGLNMDFERDRHSTSVRDETSVEV
jgi:hypothetical protein